MMAAAKCAQKNTEIFPLPISREMKPSWPKTHNQSNQGVHQGKEVEGFRLAKSVSRLKPYWACILPAKDVTEGEKKPLAESLGKHLKRKMQRFGDVSGLLVWCSYCIKGFATKYYILFTLIYFRSTCSYSFAHLKMWLSVTNDAIC